MSSDRPQNGMDEGPRIRLDQFLKLNGWVGSGGQAKLVIQAGDVIVDGQVERRRGRQLRGGERVAFARQVAVVDPEQLRP